MPGVGFVEVPSLDLWNEQAFFRMPSLVELRDPINRSEWFKTLMGGFPEAITFSRRVARSLKSNASSRYDIIHDNQSLGPGLLQLQTELPVVATIHHPITIDRRIGLKSTRNFKKLYGTWRWYGFLSDQLKVSRKLDRILTVSEASSRDLQREYGINPTRMRVVGNGINLDVFRPMPEIERRSNQLITTLSSDSPLKGFRFLLNALSELKKGRPDLKLTVIGEPGLKTSTAYKVKSLGLEEAVTFTGRVAAEDIARAYAESTIAIVPSLYEGFGFPAGEAMACEVPVVSTSAGALPEVVGKSGETGLIVKPGSSESLVRAISELLDAPERRKAMGEKGRKRVLSLFTWRRTAERTVQVYRESIEERKSRLC